MECKLKTNGAITARVGMVDVALIDRNPRQPRKRFEDIELLADSVQTHGMLQPVVLRPRDHGRFQLAAGERRLRAAKAAGLRRVPAVVREMTDAELAQIALVENLARSDLTPLETAQGYAALCAPIAEGGAGLSQAEAGRMTSRDQGTVGNFIRLLKLPPAWIRRLNDGEIDAAKGRELLPFVNSPELMAAIEKDYKANRELYSTWRGFRRQVLLIAENDPAIILRHRKPNGRPMPTISNGHGSVPTREPVAGHANRTEPPRRRVVVESDGDQAGRELERMAAQAAGLVAQLNDQGLQLVESAIAARRRQLQID